LQPSARSVTVPAVSDAAYDVALSFAGEDRPYVEAVAEGLRNRGIRVFYDKYEQVSLWGRDLYQHLSAVYNKQANYTVIFVSRHYAAKLWPQHELRNAQARAFTENRESVLPVRFDATEIPGMPPTIGYIDAASVTPGELVNIICLKLGRAQGEAVTGPTSQAPPATEQAAPHRKRPVKRSTRKPRQPSTAPALPVLPAPSPPAPDPERVLWHRRRDAVSLEWTVNNLVLFAVVVWCWYAAGSLVQPVFDFAVTGFSSSRMLPYALLALYFVLQTVASYHCASAAFSEPIGTFSTFCITPVFVSVLALAIAWAAFGYGVPSLPVFVVAFAIFHAFVWWLAYITQGGIRWVGDVRWPLFLGALNGFALWLVATLMTRWPDSASKETGSWWIPLAFLPIFSALVLSHSMVERPFGQGNRKRTAGLLFAAWVCVQFFSRQWAQPVLSHWRTIVLSCAVLFAVSVAAAIKWSDSRHRTAPVVAAPGLLGLTAVALAATPPLGSSLHALLISFILFLGGSASVTAGILLPAALLALLLAGALAVDLLAHRDLEYAQKYRAI
jgi:hypothetical protein